MNHVMLFVKLCYNVFCAIYPFISFFPNTHKLFIAFADNTHLKQQTENTFHLFSSNYNSFSYQNLNGKCDKNKNVKLKIYYAAVSIKYLYDRGFLFHDVKCYDIYVHI